MALQQLTESELTILNLKFKELNKINNEVYELLRKACGRRYSEKLVRHGNELGEIALILEDKFPNVKFL